jgi:phage-related protein
MNETQLQIIISVINDAAAQISEVGSQLSQLADQSASAASDMSSSMASAGASMDSSLTAAEEAAADASLQSANSWLDAADQIDTAVSDAADGAETSFTQISEGALAAADATSASWQTSLSDLQSQMADTAEEVDSQMAGMAESAATAGEEMESSISSVGGKFQAVGIQAGLVGAAFLAPVVEAVQDAADKTSALAEGLNQINNVIQGASGPNPENATQIASLTAQINAQKASIAEDDAALQKWTGTTVEIAAAHEKAAASIATANVNIAKLQAELAPLISQNQLVGQSAQAISTNFANLATQNTNLGVSFEDSYNALVSFLNETKSVGDATAMYGAAVDLVASGKIPDMTTAVQDVTQSFQGMGRGLQQIIPDMRDGVSGMTAVNEITAALVGSPQVAMQQYNTQVAALGQHMSDLGAAMATGLLPALTQFLETVNKIIVELTAWAEEHPKLAEAILIFLALIGGALVLLGAILVPLGLLIIAAEALTTGLALLGVAATITLGTLLLYIGIFIAMAVIVALVIVYHKQIEDAIKAAWDAIVGFVQDHWEAILNILVPGLGTLVAFLVDHWSTIKNDVQDTWNWIATFIGGIWTKIVTDAETALSAVQNLINKIMAPINAVTSAVSSITGGIGNTLGTAIKAFASGGIVNSPTLALVGEAGPEAIIPLSAFSGGASLAGAGGGSAGSINIYVQGGTYLDQNGATQIANALARQIQMQLKLKNFF